MRFVGVNVNRFQFTCKCIRINTIIPNLTRQFAPATSSVHCMMQRHQVSLQLITGSYLKLCNPDIDILIKKRDDSKMLWVRPIKVVNFACRKNGYSVTSLRVTFYKKCGTVNSSAQSLIRILSRSNMLSATLSPAPAEL